MSEPGTTKRTMLGEILRYHTSQAVPCITAIDGPLKPGKGFIIRGIVNTNPTRIDINFRHKHGIAFHFNPRFTENRIVCNTCDVAWGEPEYPSAMPFKAGQPFEVYIYCTDRGFNVFVDGNQIHTYNHRFKQLNDIDVLGVRGDLQVTSVVA
ncbi:Galectin-3 [Triplophysa tibetana]|uniref:Galectin n=1 Tax=Triplophysa tibetana TaxID=1572043 RepID=A0A5A9MZD7_9TELE|nr:Galectin-3 [Triplophysa tibetana]